jgi:3-hydroxyisobutyrate dehydrogenase-like beta-hydroxyacid dehydrogenase
LSQFGGCVWFDTQGRIPYSQSSKKEVLISQTQLIVGGKAEILEKVRKVLESIGDVIVHVGDVGFGNIAKLINNMISFGCAKIAFEGMVLEAKAGIDIRTLREVIRKSTGSNYQVQTTLPIIFGGNFEPGFHVNLAIKDIGLALGMAKE